MELLLVLAILVVAAAAVAPSFRGVMRNSSLKAAASTVRAELTRAHVLAMKTGRTQVFQYELGGAKYKVEPWIAGDDALESPAGESNSAPIVAPSSQQTPLGERTLPEGTKFVLGDAAIESRSERIEQELTSLESSGANWSRPILFFPDGSCVDAFIVIGNEFQTGIRVDLRGMTAAVKVGLVSDLQQLEDGQALSR